MRPSPTGFGPPETRFQGPGAFGFPVRKSPRAVLRKLRFPPALQGRSSDRFHAGCSGLRAGDRFAQRSSFGSTAERMAHRLLVRGRKVSSEIGRPAPETGLPCRSWSSEGRCRSILRPWPFQQGRFPSPCRGVDRSGTARLPQGDRAEVSPAKAGTRKGAGCGPESHRASGGDPEPRTMEGLPRAAFRPDGIPRDPARAPGAFCGLKAACRLRGRRKRMLESGMED